MKSIRFILLTLTSVIFLSAFIVKAQLPQQESDRSVTLAQEVVPKVGSVAIPTHQRVINDEPDISFVGLARGMLGLASLIFVAWIFSANRKGINWKVVLSALSVQFLLALGVLMVKPIQVLFGIAGKMFVTVLDFSRTGSQFLFGSLLDVDKFGPIFAFQVLPTIIFFSALTSLLFYLGIIQKIVGMLAWMLAKTVRISGAESLTAAGNIFLGQLEAPLLVKGYLQKMNRSEIMLVMVAGMATIAGGVMAVYIGFLGGNDPVQRMLFAKHLLAASVMAAPGSVVIAKILYPQGEVINEDQKFEKVSFGENILDAIAKGTWQGLKIAASVASMLLVFLALIAMINFVFVKIGAWTNLNSWVDQFSAERYHELNLQFILGYLLSPVMWLIGVCTHDMALVGQLAGEKLVTNEFVGYISLASLKDTGAFLQDKSIIMSTYMLCGFANFASVGMQIGGLGLMAPGSRKWLSEFGMKALLGGTLVSLISAAIIGMILG
jgi:concentrative nucleoside transporter, CNT family